MRKFSLFLMICVFYLFIGCGSSYQNSVSEERLSNEKIKVDAYLFDAKLKRDGKTTSVRLYFYQTDSVISVGGRGYLGKGALKGWFDSDSVLVSFPTTNEYLYESIDNLFGSFKCTGSIPQFDMMGLFTQLPNELFNDIEISVVQVNNKVKRPEFQIRYLNCPWQINVTYDLQDEQYRIRKFEFSDGDKTSLSAKRREYKPRTNVKLARFQVPIIPEYYRIIP